MLEAWWVSWIIKMEKQYSEHWIRRIFNPFLAWFRGKSWTFCIFSTLRHIILQEKLSKHLRVNHVELLHSLYQHDFIFYFRSPHFFFYQQRASVVNFPMLIKSIRKRSVSTILSSLFSSDLFCYPFPTRACHSTLNKTQQNNTHMCWNQLKESTFHFFCLDNDVRAILEGFRKGKRGFLSIYKQINENNKKIVHCVVLNNRKRNYPVNSYGNFPRTFLRFLNGIKKLWHSL